MVYKWGVGAIDRLRTLYKELVGKVVPFAAACKKILEHYDRHRSALQQFGDIVLGAAEERSHHALTVVQVVPHPRDITADDLSVALARSDQADLLRELVEISRAIFGFYVGQFTYTINYPWVAARLRYLPAGSRVLDIGAGVNPLPVWLARRGMLVDCVDPHPIARSLPATDDWNEWGFFDYGQLHPNLVSHHCSIAEFGALTGFDAIYSVCALAHMPRATREETARRCREWLRPGGRLLLTIDLIPATDFVWNRSEGSEVESPMAHGTIEDVLGHLAELNFCLNQTVVLRSLYKSRTDLLLIDCTL